MANSYRINNLTIRYNKDYKVWLVITPDKRIIEEFTFEKDAILWAQDTHDFLTDVGYRRKYGHSKPRNEIDKELWHIIREETKIRLEAKG